MCTLQDSSLVKKIYYINTRVDWWSTLHRACGQFGATSRTCSLPANSIFDLIWNVSHDTRAIILLVGATSTSKLDYSHVQEITAFYCTYKNLLNALPRPWLHCTAQAAKTDILCQEKHCHLKMWGNLEAGFAATHITPLLWWTMTCLLWLSYSILL